MTGVLRVERDGRVWFEQRYSYRDDRDRMLKAIAEDYEPPYEIVIVPDGGGVFTAARLQNTPAPLHQ